MVLQFASLMIKNWTWNSFIYKCVKVATYLSKNEHMTLNSFIRDAFEFFKRFQKCNMYKVMDSCLQWNKYHQKFKLL